MLTERDRLRAAVRGVSYPPVEPGQAEAPVARARASLGHLPAISVVTALGCALVAAAFYAGRAQVAWAEPAYWIGMGVIVVPIIVRLLAVEASRAERVGLILVLAVGLYLVKVAYSPAAFTNPDELSHQYNLLAVLQTGHLFQPNPALGITALYPGLASVTAAIASTTGLTDFQSGLLVVGATRVLLILTLFLLVERLTHSARVGGLAAVLYSANPNYLFYSAEFGYESLALPLSGLVLYAALRRDEAARGTRAAWTAIALLAALGVVITHHLTSYALVAALWGLVIVSRLMGVRARSAPWDLAVIVSVGVAAWFGLVASPTAFYLFAVLNPALLSLVRLLTLQQAPRQLFDPASALVTIPQWQALLAFGAVVLVALGLPFGLVLWWRGSRRQPVGLLLSLAGALYIPAQLLRLTAASWETANRSSEFLFAGVALLLGTAVIAAASQARPALPNWLRRAGLAAYVSVIFFGGVVVSWRPDLRLPRAYVTQAQGNDIQPQGVVLAKWAHARLGAGNSLATDESNALLLATYGQQSPWSGQANGIRPMLIAPSVTDGVRTILTGARARYVVLDRRLQSADHLVGIYPLPGPLPEQPSQLLDQAALTKFDAEPGVSRIADTGDIVVFDVSQLSGVNENPAGR